MEREKVKEIKKCLEMFAIDNKEMTLFQSPVPQGESCVKSIKYADILNLINELEENNERLAEENSIIKSNPPIIAGRSVGKTIRAKLIDYDKLKQFNKSLKDRIAELEMENKDYYDRLNNLQTYIDNHEEIWKVNTKMQLKQFAERLKEKAIVFFDEGEPIVLTSNIDETLIETTEGV